MRRGNISNRMEYALVFHVDILISRSTFKEGKFNLFDSFLEFLSLDEVPTLDYLIDPHVKSDLGALYMSGKFNIIIVRDSISSEVDIKQHLRDEFVLFNSYKEFESIFDLRDFLNRHPHIAYYFDRDTSRVSIIGDKAKHYDDLSRTLKE